MFTERPLLAAQTAAQATPPTAPTSLLGGWRARNPGLVLALLLLAGLGPFLDKAVHTDDALFVWSAKYIQQHPADFYGGQVNWWVSDVPMWIANWNPPLLSYFLAAVGWVMGWQEWALHLAMLGVAWVAARGIYALAERWCRQPLLATVVAVLCPAFLVSASTLMCDLPMLAFWLWAMVLWERAENGGENQWVRAGAASLAGLAVLTKYSAISLLPLLPLLSLLRRPRAVQWLLFLLIPAAMVAGHEAFTAKLYGHGLLASAAYHARGFRPSFPGGNLAIGVIGLAFAGGSVLPVVLLAPLLWRPRAWRPGGLLLGAGGALLWVYWEPLGLLEHAGGFQQLSYLIQVLVLGAGGCHLMFLTLRAVWAQRDAVTLALAAWLGSGLFFALVMNWLINARSFLPLVPAAAILAIRQMECGRPSPAARWFLWGVLGLAAAVAVGLVAADTEVANLERTAAREITRQYQPAGHQLWFTGHGGFQYYMQAGGARPVDVTRSRLVPGDVLVMPQLGYGLSTLPFGSVGWLGHATFRPAIPLNLAGATPTSAAGFYGANWGPLPFAIGNAPNQTYFILQVASRVNMDSQDANARSPHTDDVPSITHISCAVADPVVFPGKPEAEPELRAAQTSTAQGDLAAAITHYRAALKVDPDNAQAHVQLAWLLVTANPEALRNGPEAMSLARQGIILTGGRLPEAFGALAAACAATGDFTNAIENCRITLTLARLVGQNAVVAAAAAVMPKYMAGAVK